MALTAPTAAITAAPRYQKRNQDFLGYFSGASGWETLTCGTNEIYTTSGSYAGCYGTAWLSSHGLRSDCSNAFSASSTKVNAILSCTDTSWPCVTQTIIATQPNKGSSLINYACGAEKGFDAFTIYRNTQASSSSVSSTSASASSASTSVSITTGTSEAGVQPTSSTISTSTSTATSSPKSESHAGVIAGGVVGGIAVIAIAAGIVYLLLRRRQDRKPPIPPAEVYAPPPNGDNNGYYGMLGQKPVDTSYYAHQTPQQWERTELPGNDQQVYQLDSRQVGSQQNLSELPAEHHPK